MSNYELVINCKSDMCVSDGSVYNSMLDTDICYDRYGFPYIPAKRIRGCLRECAKELEDWGDQKTENELFGFEGDQRGLVRIGDACLSSCTEQERAFVAGHSSHPLFHPQNVLNTYTYIRTQTALDYETGVADDATLRTIRVSNKGLVFRAPVAVFGDDETIGKKLERCCALFRSIGVGRTRGFGEIEVRLEPVLKEDKDLGHEKLEEGATRLNYEITLVDPVVLKSVSGGEANSQDYIEGAKIIGLVAEEMRNTGGLQISELLSADERLFFSDAFIMADGRRCYEVPAYMRTVKNKFGESRNRLYHTDIREKKQDVDESGNPLQINQMKHCYVYEDAPNRLVCTNVDMEERYHHRRPADKAIGRAISEAETGSGLYQISSILQGQCFGGFITGTPESVKRIYEALSRKNAYLIGYGRSSEYGRINLRITGTEKEVERETAHGTHLVVTLRSPAIVYGDKAFYSTDQADLTEEIRATLGLPADAEIIGRYIRYTETGGYNVTWKSRKPVISAFDKGSAVIFRLKEENAIRLPAFCAVGERTQEGFGEIDIRMFSPEADLYTGTIGKPGEGENGAAEILNIRDSAVSSDIADRLFMSFVRFKAAGKAKAFFSERRSYRPTLANLTQICDETAAEWKREQKTGCFLDGVRAVAKKRYESKSNNKSRSSSDRKQRKLTQALEMIKDAKEHCDTLVKDFKEEFRIDGFSCDENKVKREYLSAFLMYGKYELKKREVTNDGESDYRQNLL